MFEKRNETLLNNEFTARRMREAENERLAQQFVPQRQKPSTSFRSRKVMWGIASFVLLAVLILTGASAVSAEETIMTPVDSGTGNLAMDAFSYGFNAMNDGEHAIAITYLRLSS